MATWRDRPARELGELAPMVGEALGQAYERAAEPPAVKMRRERRRKQISETGAETRYGALGYPPTFAPEHAPPGGIAAAMADTGGGIVGSERRMAPRRAAAGLVDPASEPAPAPDLGDPVTEAQKPANDPEKVRIEGMFPTGEPSGIAAEVQRREGGSGMDWVREQATRTQGRQVFGFPRLASHVAAKKAGIEEAAAAPPPPDERTMGVSGIPQGISRAPSPPGMQARELREFQDAETARYADYDIARAQQEAELAQQQALTADPFAEIGAETAGRKELIEAEGEAQQGVIGAGIEAQGAADRKQGVAYEARLAEIQQAESNKLAQKMQELTESPGWAEMDPKEQEAEIAAAQQAVRREFDAQRNILPYALSGDPRYAQRFGEEYGMDELLGR